MSLSQKIGHRCYSFNLRRQILFSILEHLRIGIAHSNNLFLEYQNHAFPELFQ